MGNPGLVVCEICWKGERMYEKIMVPLDGSKLAECALPHVEKISTGGNTVEVILVSVTERLVGRTRAPEVEQLYRMSDMEGLSQADSDMAVTLGKKERQAQRYLSRIAKRLETSTVKVRTEVLLGHPAEAIASYAERDPCDLIIMASHGRSGPSRWAYGSVADRVLRASCVPVLMVRAPGCVPGV
jgi:nucleotide-binding universal stress UspA family protein